MCLLQIRHMATNLHVLEIVVQDVNKNWTRFWNLGQTPFRLNVYLEYNDTTLNLKFNVYLKYNETTNHCRNLNLHVYLKYDM